MTEPVALVAPVAAPVKRRSARTWVLTSILALLLAAGGGYGGYQLVMSRPVTVTEGKLTVKVSREWNQKSTNADKTALLVTTDTQQWQTNSNVPGVYLAVQAGTVPKTGKPTSGCTPVSENPASTATDNALFYYQCGPDHYVGERYQLVQGVGVLWTQVRSSTRADVNEVLGSVSYTP